MKKSSIVNRIMVSGDNKNGQLFMKGPFQVTPKFIKSNNFPDNIQISQITHVSSYDQSIVFVVNDTSIIFRKSNNDMINLRSPGVLKKILCLKDLVFALLFDGTIYDCTNEIFFYGSGYKTFSVSESFYAAIKNNGDVFIFDIKDVSSEPKKIASKGNCVGCTGELVFISTDKDVIKYDGKSLHALECKSKIVEIYSSLNEILFLDSSGSLYQYDQNALLLIFGLPPVVYAATGIQHFAAIGFDGSLYTWGFNPSGQLGIGNDKTTFDPVHVLDGCRLVACGSHHTLAICGDGPSIPKSIKIDSINRLLPSTKVETTRISRAELL